MCYKPNTMKWSNIGTVFWVTLDEDTNMTSGTLEVITQYLSTALTCPECFHVYVPFYVQFFLLTILHSLPIGTVCASHLTDPPFLQWQSTLLARDQSTSLQVQLLSLSGLLTYSFQLGIQEPSELGDGEEEEELANFCHTFINCQSCSCPTCSSFLHHPQPPPYIHIASIPWMGIYPGGGFVSWTFQILMVSWLSQSSWCEWWMHLRVVYFKNHIQ